MTLSINIISSYMYFVKSSTEKYGTFHTNYSRIYHIGIDHKTGKAFSFKYIL